LLLKKSELTSLGDSQLRHEFSLKRKKI